jgi:TRAP-type mannitol/chloroaromatic compound transport system substrate-binding protein
MNKQQYANMMERRQFLKLASMGALGAAALAACSSGDPALDEAAQDETLPELDWEIATSWPTSLDTIYGGATTFADRVSAMTGGRFMITAQPANEVVPALEILQNVETNSIDGGHTASYYYTGLDPTTAFGTAIPFGLNARQQNAWLYEGQGLELLQAFYADRFNAIQFPAGNTGVQMGGWFNVEVQSVSDLQGLRMRIPGLGGEVMTALGVTVQVIAGGEIFQALQTNAVDAAEWVGPYDDQILGFQDVAQFYYHPGWWEPGPSLEVQIPLPKWDDLPDVYQEIIKTAAYEANTSMMAAYDAKNPQAFQEILNNSDVTVLPYPDDVMEAAADAANDINETKAAENAEFKTVYDNWKAFRDQIHPWFAIAETSYLDFTAARVSGGEG